MTNTEFQNATDLERVRVIRYTLEQLDVSVGEIIKDEEHAAIRRTVRSWEMRLQDSIKVRADRKAAL